MLETAGAEYSFGDEKGKNSDALYRLVSTASFIRLYLWNMIQGKDTSEKLMEQFRKCPWMLQNQQMHAEWTHLMQHELDWQAFVGANKIDYTLDGDGKNSSSLYILSGENKLIYSMMLFFLKSPLRLDRFGTLFYAYILIFIRFRREIIQCNRAYGFDNFENYQSRKELFLNEEYSKEVERTALAIPLENEALKSLEARIVLPADKDRFYRWLKDYYDSIPEREEIQERHHHFRKKDSRVFFVIHIPKQADEKCDFEKMLQIPYRHQKFRINVVRPVVQMVVELFRYRNRLARGIYGLDACNQEIVCRPEVFAPEFRYARQMAVPEDDQLVKGDFMPTLRVTYHVGEDFLDMTDGLRAIEEAVLFLEMKSGDRLGHALALGIDPKEWYGKRSYSLVLSAQDALDNIAWIRHKLCKIGYDDGPLLDWLKSQYEILCVRIFGKVIPHTIYHHAWRLRGNDPGMYRNLDEIDCLFEPWRVIGGNGKTGIRDIERKVSDIYRQYHYDKDVRIQGASQIAFTPPRRYARAVQAVQETMQEYILQRKIGIETNPSSNFLISRFEAYGKHPIVRFNDRFLCEGNPDKALFVSINTDDPGVFDTDLENEYALMACGLEEVFDETGRQMYTPEKIHLWLDYVREMGLEQSFRGAEE